MTSDSVATLPIVYLVFTKLVIFCKCKNVILGARLGSRSLRRFKFERSLLAQICHSLMWFINVIEKSNKQRLKEKFSQYDKVLVL